MAELRWIQMFVLMILMLQFTVTSRFSYITVRDGEDVTLSCQNEVNDDDKCSLTHWFFRVSQEAPATALVKSGQIDQTQLPRSRSDRLSVTEKCSLFIKSVTEEDVGQFFCRQRGRDSGFDLAVVILTEQKMDHGVTLSCFVQRTGKCEHTVKWLFKSQTVGKEHQEFQPSQTSCFASQSVKESHYIYSSRFTAFQCEVTDPDGNKHRFSFRQSGSDSKTTAAPTTTKMYNAGNQKGLSDWQWALIAVTGIIAAVVIAVLLMRKHGKKTQRNENMVKSDYDTKQADPQDEHSYASISFTHSSDRAEVQNLPKAAAVTYSTVKASSDDGASADLSSLYAVIEEVK
ncbi:uncharacterized protein LOC114849729 isoform X2 [Betta splendens]|uniref:Uncharacterized protein LOC114849729 isoform X2 n=1 Tax=Betta splendens TaxID=158456 RepID=A0A9W2XL53_BETSP|nr:uncharacterized protein LOC114849729 isoform X2 [Betta splendens]